MGISNLVCIECRCELKPRARLRFEVTINAPHGDETPDRYKVVYCEDCAPPELLRRALLDDPERRGPLPKPQRRRPQTGAVVTVSRGLGIPAGPGYKHPLRD